MLPKRHALVTGIIAGLCFMHTQSPGATLSTILAGFFVDLDHLVDYVIWWNKTGRKKKLNLGDFWACKFFEDSGKLYIFFHSYELLLPLWVFAFYLDASLSAVWISVSFVTHLLMDHIEYQVYPLSYILTFRAINGFEHKSIFTLHTATNLPDTKESL